MSSRASAQAAPDQLAVPAVGWTLELRLRARFRRTLYLTLRPGFRRTLSCGALLGTARRLPHST